MSEFDQKTYIQTANEREHAKPEEKKDAKPPENTNGTQPQAAAQPEEAKDVQGQSDPMGRSQRRLLRQLGKAEGKAEALRELLDRQLGDARAGGEAATEAQDDPEPLRKDYASDAEHNRALGRWDARQEAKKTTGEVIRTADENRQFQQRIKDMDAKANDDKALYEDWDKVAEDAAENGPEFDPGENATLMGLIGSSDVKAGIYYHLAKNPDVLEAMLELGKSPNELIRRFHRLEGRIEDQMDGLRKAAQAAKDKEKGKAPSKDRKEQSTAERDAKKPKPSESAAARGGSAPGQVTSPLLADGKTINAAWIAERNTREGLRR